MSMSMHNKCHAFSANVQMPNKFSFASTKYYMLKLSRGLAKLRTGIPKVSCS
jgi:hypothetical protein